MSASPTPAPPSTPTPTPVAPLTGDTAAIDWLAAADVAIQALIAALTLFALAWAIVSARLADRRAALAEKRLEDERRRNDEREGERAVTDAVRACVAVLTSAETTEAVDTVSSPTIAPQHLPASAVLKLRRAYYSLMQAVIQAGAISQASGDIDAVRLRLADVADEAVGEVFELVETAYNAFRFGWAPEDDESPTIATTLDDRRYAGFRRAAVILGLTWPDFRTEHEARAERLDEDRVRNLAKTIRQSAGVPF